MGGGLNKGMEKHSRGYNCSRDSRKEAQRSGKEIISQKCQVRELFSGLKDYSARIFNKYKDLSARIINKYTYMHNYEISRHLSRDALNLGGRQD